MEHDHGRTTPGRVLGPDQERRNALGRPIRLDLGGEGKVLDELPPSGSIGTVDPRIERYAWAVEQLEKGGTDLGWRRLGRETRASSNEEQKANGETSRVHGGLAG